MDNKEAIEYLSESTIESKHSDNSPWDNEHNQAIGLAIEALEKQIPIKLIDTWKGKKCPNCREGIHDSILDDEETEYCPNCGQRWII